MSAVAELPVVEPAEVYPERAKPVFWEGIFRRFGRLNRSEVAVIQAVHEMPWAKLPELAEKVGLHPSTVSTIRNAEWFGQVLRAYAEARRTLFCAKYDAILEFSLDDTAKRLHERKPTSEDIAFLTLCGKATGRLGADQQLQVNVSGNGSQVLVIEQRVAAALKRAGVTPSAGDQRSEVVAAVQAPAEQDTRP